MTNNQLVAAIHDIISNIKPSDTTEKEHIRDALDWTTQTDNIFRIEKPDIPPKHLVSYFVLVDPVHNSILLCDHIKAQLWLPSGGHVSPGEHPVDTVRRECVEELNKTATFLNSEKPLFITVTETVGLHPGHTDVSLWYVITGSKFDYIQFDRSEFNDIEWYSFDEILESNPTIFDPHMQRFTRKLMRHLGVVLSLRSLAHHDQVA